MTTQRYYVQLWRMEKAKYYPGPLGATVMVKESDYEALETQLLEAQHELAILHDHYKLYPGAWCCSLSRATNGWHHEQTCKNWVLTF